jgi:hypothetical protein
MVTTDKNMGNEWWKFVPVALTFPFVRKWDGVGRGQIFKTINEIHI